MMAPVFIGDETTAAGFRLAGFETEIPPPGEAGKALSRVHQQTRLVLITAACARDIPDQDLDEAMRATAPLLLVVPDINAAVEPPDLAVRIRQILGIET